MSNEVQIEGLLTIAQAARRRGVSVSAVYKAMSAGRLQKQKALGRTVLRTADVDAWQPAGHGGARPRRKKAADTAGNGRSGQ